VGIGVEVSCPCFGSFELLIGPSPRPPETCWFPFLCRACRCCSNLNIHAGQHQCQHCGSPDVVPYGNPEAVGELGPTVVFKCWPCERFQPKALTLTDGRYWCPSCKRFTASFRDCGIRWD
jgi:hypothetical protein